MATKIKICGITNLDDALAMAKLGADYLGFIFVSDSPRRIEINQAKEIIAQVKKNNQHIKCVGVFANEAIDVVKDVVAKCGLAVVQLHGQESVEYCRNLKHQVEVWKSLIIKSAADVKIARNYYNSADKILFDSGRGSGRQFDYNLLAGVKVDVLAGGLDCDNVVGAIGQVNPTVVDLNSQLELSPGRKDINLVRQAVNKIRSILI